MPTFRHGRLTKLYLEDMASSGQNVSATLREVNFPVTTDTPETTAFGSTFKTYVIGIKEGRFTASGMFDATADSNFQSLYGKEGPTAGNSNAKTGFGFTYYPEGEPAAAADGARVRYYGRAHLANYQISGSVGDMVAVSAEFLVTSNVVRELAPTGTTGLAPAVSGL